MQAIAVVGTKKSGKTTTTENLIRELTKRGYNVAAIKHIPEPDFTIDTPGKDTWRYAQAGAKTVISVATNETVTIEKTANAKFYCDCRCGNNNCESYYNYIPPCQFLVSIHFLSPSSRTITVPRRTKL